MLRCMIGKVFDFVDWLDYWLEDPVRCVVGTFVAPLITVPAVGFTKILTPVMDYAAGVEREPEVFDINHPPPVDKLELLGEIGWSFS